MFTDRSKAVLLLWTICVIYVLCLSALVPCGHLLRKGWPLGSCLWCLIVLLSLSHVVSWVRCGTWLYWFLISAVFLTLNGLRRYRQFFEEIQKPMLASWQIASSLSYLHISCTPDKDVWDLPLNRKSFLPPLPMYDRLSAHVRKCCLTWPRDCFLTWAA